MGPTPIRTAFLLTALLAVVLLELAAAYLGTRWQIPRIDLIAIARMAQTLALLTLTLVQAGSLRVFGLDKASILPGLKKGMAWSAGFAAAAALLFIGLYMAGQDPLALVRSALPEGAKQQVHFFLVAGIVGPVFEEILFRGIIFGFLRRWNVTAAVLVSTAVFAAFHLPGIPVTQIVGGIVFAVAYHTGKSLMVPIVIHVLGNLAIFSLSLPFFH
jgi:membrane protease YdiL (CAAX protease family)